MRKRAVSLFMLFVIATGVISTGAPTSAQTASPSPSPSASPTGSPTQGTPAPTASITASPSATPTIPLSSTASPTSTPNPGATVTPSPEDRKFPQTGYTVPGVFIKYWDSHGALPVFGYPITDAHIEKSKIDGKNYLVQYFQRNRFEWHPEFAGTQNEVLLGLLGVELTKNRHFETVNAFTSTDTRVYMAPTQHSLTEPFLSYWRNNGGLAIFGYPISEVIQEQDPSDSSKMLTVQYFERNRFESHPENQAPYNVLLGLLGVQLKDLMALVNPWGASGVQGVPTPADPVWMPVKPEVGGKFLQSGHVDNGMIVQEYYQDRGRINSMVNDLNFGWIKQQIEWKDTESPKGAFFFDELDRIVNDANAHNLKVMVSIAKAPTWETGGGNGLPKDPQDLQDFTFALATHFKGRVGAYEIWNEQNLSGETGDVNPGRYVEVLKAGYLGIKAGDPAAIVVSGALAPTGVNDPLGKRAPGAMGAMPDTLFLDQMYQYNNGVVRQYFDVLGSHPYGFNNPPDTKWPDNPNLNPSFPYNPAVGKPDYYNLSNSFYFRRIEEQRTVMEKYGDGQKQMWLTEYGWCSDYRPDGYGECKYVTPDNQGTYVVAAMQRAKTAYPWMGVMFLWNLNFSTFQEWYTGPSHFSIINPDWSPRPAYTAIKNRPLSP